MAATLLDAVFAVARALESAGARFVVGGSLSSSLQGIPRSTLDGDLVTDLQDRQIATFVDRLGEGFYLDEDRVREGVHRRASFNVIALAGGFKVDVYIAGVDPYSRAQITRGHTVEVRPGEALPFLSPEDVVLQKLRWYQLENEVSERQWLDVLGVLKVQGQGLDREYLAHGAAALGLVDLLHRAYEDSGL